MSGLPSVPRRHFNVRVSVMIFVERRRTLRETEEATVKLSGPLATTLFFVLPVGALAACSGSPIPSPTATVTVVATQPANPSPYPPSPGEASSQPTGGTDVPTASVNDETPSETAPSYPGGSPDLSSGNPSAPPILGSDVAQRELSLADFFNASVACWMLLSGGVFAIMRYVTS